LIGDWPAHDDARPGWMSCDLDSGQVEIGLEKSLRNLKDKIEVRRQAACHYAVDGGHAGSQFAIAWRNRANDRIRIARIAAKHLVNIKRRRRYDG
jgi:hypothetical protein